MDQVVLGNSSLHVSGSPLYKKMTFALAGEIQSPTPCAEIVQNCSVFDRWAEVFPDPISPHDQIEEPGIKPRFDAIARGGNFEPFMQMLGLPSISLRYIDETLPDQNIPHFHTALHRCIAEF